MRDPMTVDDVLAWLSDVVRAEGEHETAAYRDRLTAAKMIVEIYDTEYDRHGDDDEYIVFVGEERFRNEDLTDSECKECNHDI